MCFSLYKEKNHCLLVRLHKEQLSAEKIITPLLESIFWNSACQHLINDQPVFDHAGYWTFYFVDKKKHSLSNRPSVCVGGFLSIQVYLCLNVSFVKRR